jgi:hypothetical protein
LCSALLRRALCEKALRPGCSGPQLQLSQHSWSCERVASVSSTTPRTSGRAIGTSSSPMSSTLSWMTSLGVCLERCVTWRERPSAQVARGGDGYRGRACGNRRARVSLLGLAVAVVIDGLMRSVDRPSLGRTLASFFITRLLRDRGLGRWLWFRRWLLFRVLVRHVWAPIGHPEQWPSTSLSGRSRW